MSHRAALWPQATRPAESPVGPRATSLRSRPSAPDYTACGVSTPPRPTSTKFFFPSLCPESRFPVWSISLPFSFFRALFLFPSPDPSTGETHVCAHLVPPAKGGCQAGGLRPRLRSLRCSRSASGAFRLRSCHSAPGYAARVVAGPPQSTQPAMSPVCPRLRSLPCRPSAPDYPACGVAFPPQATQPRGYPSRLMRNVKNFEAGCFFIFALRTPFSVCFFFPSEKIFSVFRGPFSSSPDPSTGERKICGHPVPPAEGGCQGGLRPKLRGRRCRRSAPRSILPAVSPVGPRRRSPWIGQSAPAAFRLRSCHFHPSLCSPCICLSAPSCTACGLRQSWTAPPGRWSSVVFTVETAPEAAGVRSFSGGQSPFGGFLRWTLPPRQLGGF